MPTGRSLGTRADNAAPGHQRQQLALVALPERVVSGRPAAIAAWLARKARGQRG
ncbi:MAG: hypothetical protein IPH64_16255 [Comamonadaceae bacterium]|nr:hypothetical protein [Comamonadaceae bacterium]